MTLRIPLTKGLSTLIDAEDAPWLDAGRVYHNNGYASLAIGRRIVMLHRLIMGAIAGEVVDHINGDGLDNRKANLRLCSTAENSRNRKLSKNNLSGFKGVKLKKNLKAPWHAVICLNGQSVSLGMHTSMYGAAAAYDDAAVQLFGGFARLNFDPKRDWIIPFDRVGSRLASIEGEAQAVAAPPGGAP